MTRERLRFLKCISNGTRLQILTLLAEDERCVCEIEEKIGKEQSLVSHHLKSMLKCGLIKKRREGRRRIYSLADPSIEKFLDEIDELSRNFCQGV